MRFTLPGDLYHGEYALDVLKALTGEKAFVVVGGDSMEHFGFLDKVVDYLKEADTEVQFFRGAEPDPSIETVMKGAKTMEEFNPGWIVTMGGGSLIDTAKAIWVFYEYPDTSFEDLIIPSNFPILRTKARFYVIPSISDTATEVIAFSAIIDYSKGIKYPLAGFNITPGVVIVDLALAETIPKKLTVHTDMDAMAHTTEAYASTLDCEYTGPLVLHAIKMINEYLTPSYNEDMEARDKMYNAQCLAGAAFSNALLGIAHSMAHKIGVAYLGGYIVHGYANAVYLLKVIKHNSKKPEAAARYAKTVKLINLPGTTNQELTGTLITRVREMNKGLGIPTCIRDYEGGIINEKEFMEKLPAVAELVVGDVYIGSNPRFVIPAQVKKLLMCCFYDGEVTF